MALDRGRPFETLEESFLLLRLDAFSGVTDLDARAVLETLNPSTSNDTETLGLWGAIHKRLWEVTEERKYLDDAVRGYERGFYLRNDYYNGLNLAYLLNVRAANAASQAEAIADFVQAERVRREVVQICEEWLASVPKHILLYRYFEWDQPVFMHLSLMRNADKSKLSKRKNPTSISYYSALGYVPEALMNFLGLFFMQIAEGEELMTMAELTEKFDPENLSKSGAIFDIQKLDWLNGRWLREKFSEEEFAARVLRHSVICSRTAGFFTTIERRAASEMEPMIATGMAMSNGQGVAITSTARKRIASPLTAQASTAMVTAIGV